MKAFNILLTTIIIQLLIFQGSINAQFINDFLVNEQGSIDGAIQGEPNMSGNENGIFVLTWKDKRNGSDYDIYAQIYQFDGTPVGDNFRVNDDFGTRRQYEPAVAVAPDASFVIAWVDRRNGDINTHWDLYAQRYANDGTPLGNNFMVNSETDSFEKNKPSIAIDSIGNFVVVWADKLTYKWDIYGKRFNSNVVALGSKFKINDDIGDFWQAMPTAASDKSGNVIVSWVDERNGSNYKVYAQRYAPDGSEQGSNFQVTDNNSGGNNIYPDISIDGYGNFIIAWADNRNGYYDIYAQRYLSDGSTLDGNFKINEAISNTSQDNPSISSDVEGNFIVSWEDNRNDYNDVYARRFTNNGTAISGDFKVSNDLTYNAKQENAIIGCNGSGNFLICWEDHLFGFNGEIYAQAFSNDGTVLGENIMINDDIASENQQWPSMAVDENGKVVIVWADNRLIDNGIYGQQFSSDGTAIGNNFKVNDDDGENWTLYPSVAINNDGSFVVAWSDARWGDNHAIFAQRFANDASPLGSNFQVNNLSAAINVKPVVATKQNGDFIIVWGDSDEGGKEKTLLGAPDIWGQQFQNDGTPIGENFKVNDDEGFESQMYPDIAVDAVGNFTITWKDKRNDFWEIYLQRYLSDGTPIGSNFKVEDAIYCDWALDPAICMDETGDFIVTWYDDRNDHFDIYFKRFNNDGTPMESSFQVTNNSTGSYLSYPRIALGNDDRFIISWMEQQEGGNHKIFAQRFLSDATPFSETTQLPQQTGNDQACQDVVLYNNQIYSAWHDNKSMQTGFDIWANIIDWDFNVGTNDNVHNTTGEKTILFQNQPNPFHSATLISYFLKNKGFVGIKIYNQYGMEVGNYVNKTQKAGYHSLHIDANDFENGIYFYSLQFNQRSVGEKKLILMK